jgi:hypothetical protein
MFPEIVTVILKENGGFPDVVLADALELGRERALAEDKALGIKRDCIPFHLIRFPIRLKVEIAKSWLKRLEALLSLT